ncbi:MaoC family dehydratase [Hydrogenophaga intermedia]|uniref:MaoC family dehydratase n=1 Tax=Hydrogenophaga intermedia TaxID=65786 RepID=UPI0020430C9B|nr:MaoC family dehydratase [Hydrogenophaga intermedia]MCM3562767.1 MaoC family dehydratase [Hydrogenophaga intermedia]
MTFNPQQVAIGDAMPVLQLPPISRTTLALFAGASGDHNPIHIDIDFARKAGMKDVFAHGMLSMAYLARALTQWVPQQRILSYAVRFAAITHVADRVQCSGKVVEKLTRAGRPCARIELIATKHSGEVTLAGEALVALD